MNFDFEMATFLGFFSSWGGVTVGESSHYSFGGCTLNTWTQTMQVGKVTHGLIVGHLTTLGSGISWCKLPSLTGGLSYYTIADVFLNWKGDE